MEETRTNKLLEVFLNIDIASEIARATITEVMRNMDNERIEYVLMGVLQQLESINKAIDDMDMAMCDVA